MLFLPVHCHNHDVTAAVSPASGAGGSIAARAIEMASGWLRGGRKRTAAKVGDPRTSTELLASVSHDLLTPITRMKLRAELISACAVQQKFMADLDEVDGLVRSILAYAASAHGRAEACVNVELASLLRCLTLDYRDSGKDVELSDTFPAVVPTQPRSLRRILTNLIDNALKYAGAAEIAMEINEGASLSIRVLDRGPGLPEEHLRTVIRPFVRLGSGSNVAEGLGLGLATASNLAHALSGSLSLSNREGGGLKAELRLPGYRQPC
ncbi:HAMP domain-containing sensor histidine kinase [Bosea sp. (in: a-proteobacteria)]|uniref:sensor histidine kinase n=1 Tax=Bosea sp. (in: a-proteobacteria) TaxID=1871050 RepID=UPI0025C28417|nr:HAMP domain-containing sensor histidine kinase [Bosea sp. (in: a-proteobacteria)]